MTQYNSLNVKLLNSQLNKLKSAIKNKTEVFLRLLPKVIGNSDDKTNFPRKLLLTNRQVPNLHNQSRTFLGRLLGPLLKTRVPLIKNVIKPLAKSTLISLGSTAAAWAADAGIYKKILGSGHPSDSASHYTKLIISNDEMEGIAKIVQSLEDFGLSLKGVSETVQNEVKE